MLYRAGNIQERRVMSDSEKLTKVYSHCNTGLAWAVFGEHGGIHLHCSAGDFSSGGIEIHSRTPLHDGHKPHGHTNCWLIGCPCYHDGSSLQWSERLVRYAEMYLFSERQRGWWEMIAYEYASRFKTKAHVDCAEYAVTAEELAASRLLLAASQL